MKVMLIASIDLYNV